MINLTKMQFTKKLMQKLAKDKFSNLKSDLYLIHQILHQYFKSNESEPKEIKLNFQFSISDRDDDKSEAEKSRQKTKKALEMLNKINGAMTSIDIIKLKNGVM